MKPTLKIKILCLDDHTQTLEAMDELFSVRGLENYEMLSSEETFLEHLDEDVHIAVIDYKLQGQRTGLDVCKKLFETNPQCFAIIISAIDDSRIIRDFMNSGADRFVTKQDPDWLEQVYRFVSEGIEFIKKELDWYYSLIKKERESHGLILKPISEPNGST